MSSQHLKAIVDELRQERAALEEQVGHLRGQLAALEENLQRIDAAEKALAGEATKPLAAKAVRIRTAKASPSPKKTDVVAAINRVLGRDGELPLDVLKRIVEGELTAQGFNRSGFAMRFREACEEAFFLRTADGLRLVTAPRGEAEVTNVAQDRPFVAATDDGNRDASFLNPTEPKATRTHPMHNVLQEKKGP